MIDVSASTPTGGGTNTYFERFGVGPEQIRALLGAALSMGADDCDLYFEHAAQRSVGLVNGQVDRASTGVDLGMGVRVRLGDRFGYSYTEVLEPDAMLAAARVAAGIANGPGGVAVQPLHGMQHAHLYPVTSPWGAVGLDQRVPLVRSWEAAAFTMDERLTHVQVWLADEERVILIARPDGRLVQDYQPMMMCGLVCIIQAGTRRETASAAWSARRGWETCREPGAGLAMVRRAVDEAAFLLEAQRPPAGELPVVLASGTSGLLLHEAVGHGLEADFNRMGTSIFSGRMGEQVADPLVTVVDDGTLAHERGSINVDDEGNPAERTVLIQEGRLVSYLHDEISAAHYGVPLTGSGRRESYAVAPMPRMRTTLLMPGPHAPEEIIASVKKGIYCSTFGGGQVNIGAGDFTFFMKRGYLIEDGRLTRPLKDANITGNGPAALGRITMVGDDLALDPGGGSCGKQGQTVPVGHGLPTVLVTSLVVGGVGQ